MNTARFMSLSVFEGNGDNLWQVIERAEILGVRLSFFCELQQLIRFCEL
jgi:hypothetical protein